MKDYLSETEVKLTMWQTRKRETHHKMPNKQEEYQNSGDNKGKKATKRKYSI